MKNPVKEFFHRGLIFGGFGPIVMAVIYLILSYTTKEFSLDGLEVFVAIISTYILAFIHAGASVFNQIEGLPIMKSILYHFLTLYVAYTVCYLINSWLPFDVKVLLIYTAIFIVVYLIIWAVVLTSVKATERKMNKKI